MIKKILIPFCATLILSSCATMKTGGTTFDVNGMVYDMKNRPIAGYSISLGEKRTVTTDITGRFTISKVLAGNYKITGSKTSYEPYSGEVIIEDSKTVIYLSIPSVQQLLEYADSALQSNRLIEAEEYLQRVKKTDYAQSDLLFYTAVLQFRKKEYKGARELLESMLASGVTDPAVKQFLKDIEKKEMSNE